MQKIPPSYERPMRILQLDYKTDFDDFPTVCSNRNVNSHKHQT